MHTAIAIIEPASAKNNTFAPTELRWPEAPRIVAFTAVVATADAAGDMESDLRRESHRP